ncbi:hypothetical protein ACQKP8_18080 [Photobacterium alginatilyticum]|uniref:hypothetical protein n=1 Tax=Photobacterium alginatilyticum TaxID=1775171 RepID=UPI0040678006
MNRYIFPATVLALALSPHLFAANLEAAADDVCVCLEGPYQHAEETLALVNEALQSGDMSKILASQDEMMKVMNTSELCIEDLSKKYPDISADESLQKEVMRIADEKCPNPLEQLKSASAPSS